MKKYILICVLVMSACKSITYQDVNPQIQPNSNLLPAMESVIDMNNLEATYTVGSYNGNANNIGTGIGSTSWMQTTAVSGTTYKDARVNDVINIFEKEIKENITSPYGEKKGFIVLKLGYRGVETSTLYPLVSLFTLGTINFLGFPANEVSQSLEVEIEIWNKKKELIKRYVVNVTDTEYQAMYWGYHNLMIGRKLAADNIKQALEKIRFQINEDAQQIKRELNK